ncbi:uncharacterized protein LOC112688653 [Sipha flava]|jgi:hypothetical protein|uniref:Uncharacterized protein LOC112688653 n=1 Tax=Sipha flava TaxID=143950 RepID=A0A2S2QGZ1_9HEMI|nr:uncharacterized protein LOC112688653 [Sipha flava]XP_025417741.1 uncharacterized protein LOC112688653 [Sipha flava]XP_025417742.1 uncharacterized protein LOC112688653 [Sipha flava]
MKTSEILSTSNLRVLRNGKIVSLKENTKIKKKSTLKKDKNDNLSFLKNGYSGVSNLHDNNLNDPHKMMVNTNNYDLGGLCILLKNLPNSVIHEDPFYNKKDNSSNKNDYTNLEDYIQLNEVQICNKLEAKTEIKPKLLPMKNVNQKVGTRKSLIKKNNIATKEVGGSIDYQNIDVRMTRGKIIKLQTEERKQLDQIIFNKFPKIKFKMFAIQLDDIYKEEKFLRTLGLTCRFKSPLTFKTKKK